MCIYTHGGIIEHKPLPLNSLSFSIRRFTNPERFSFPEILPISSADSESSPKTHMKMQKTSPNYASTAATPSLSSSSSSSSTSSSPSHSSITSHSLVASSMDSSASFPSPSSSPSRCFGLNLLVKAIHQVTAGSVVGVPYIQRRIVTRRRRPLRFNNLIVNTEFLSKPKSKSRRQRRVNMAMPSKYRDSVLQPLTPKRRAMERSCSIKIIGE